ncbi:MAG: hypothetical protein ACTSUT_04375 [Promethearchaeota archaeon]
MIQEQRKKYYHHIKEIAENNDLVLKSKDYINSDTPLTFKCNHCNNDINDTWRRIRGRGNIVKCSYCFPDKTKEDYHNEIKDIIELKGGKLLSDEYINARTKVLVECDKGHIWLVTSNDLKSGYWCKRCFIEDRRKKIYEEIMNIVDNKGGKLHSIKFRGKHKSAIAKITCENGHTINIRTDSIKLGKWCLKCFLDKDKKYKLLKEFIKSKGGKLLSEEYIHSHSKVLVECNKGHRWLVTPTNLKSGTWCPECSNGKYEKIIRWYFEQIFSYIKGFSIKFPVTMICDIINFKAFKEMPIRYRGLHIELMHFDGYSVVEINGIIFKIAFEYNGEQHYKFPNIFHDDTKEGKIKYERQILLDEYKKWICSKKRVNIILIEIPFSISPRMDNPIKIQESIIKIIEKNLKINLKHKIPIFDYRYNELN